jgi:uncharacterized protein YndB with AHSA1/START domain
VDPVTVSLNIARPRAEVFDYLADIANHAEFTDHYLKRWHLTREDSVGTGAGARFFIDAPLNRYSWADLTFVEVTPPLRIVGVGAGGKFNRNRLRTEYVLTDGPHGQTRVELSAETEPKLLSDRLMEAIAGRGWVRRKSRKALRRLRSILEEDEERGSRTTVAGL